MKIKVTPKTGLKITNPETGKRLAVGGEVVEDTSYWRRRAGCMDVTITAAPAPAKAKVAAKGTTDGL